MKNCKLLLSLDPSGAFTEGKGTTGYCFYDADLNQIIECADISAYSYATKEEYWHAHIDLIKHFKEQYPEFIVVIEDYLLYAHKAESQINSRLETPKLIGILQHWCWDNNIPVRMQIAGEVKNRWNNDVLIHKGVLIEKGRGYAIASTGQSVNKHCIDAIRHAIHYATFKRKRDKL